MTKHEWIFNIITWTRKFSLLIVFGVLLAYFSWKIPNFLTVGNMFSIIRIASILGILALGYTALLILSEFDISYTANAALVSVVVALLIGEVGLNMYVTFLVAFGLAIGIGYINGIISTKIGIASFIATLGMKGALDGIARILTGGAIYFHAHWPKGFGFAKVYLGGVAPMAAVLYLITAIVLVILLEYSLTGRYFYAIGGSSTAAAHTGINVSSLKLKGFILTGGICGFAGIIGVSMFGSAGPMMYERYWLMGFIATFLGGVFVKDGIINVWGTVVASFVLALLANGFIFLGISQGYQRIIEGIVLVVAVGVVSLMRGGLRGLRLPVRV